MKTTTGWICLALVLAACAANPQATKQTAGDQLYEAVTGGKEPMLAVIDARSHGAVKSVALGTPSSDWSRIYTTVGTSLVVTDTATGDTVNALQLPGAYHLPAATANGVPGGLSPDGHWLVVERLDGGMTSMLVIDTKELRIKAHVALSGTFEFDAIDDQAASLYLIQRLGGRDYYVRLYDLATGSLSPNVIVDKSDGGQAMTGVRLSGIPSVDGQWLFSIYVRAHQSPFIHALSLSAPFALCLDLPGKGYLDDPAEMQWSLAMSPDRSRIYAVNTAVGEVAVMSNDSSGPTITRTAHFSPQPSPAAHEMHGAYGAVIRGATLIAGGPAGLTWIDVSSLQVVARSIPGWSIPTVGLSPDGKRLYAVSEEGRVAAIEVDSRKVAGVFDPLAGTPMALMRVAGA